MKRLKEWIVRNLNSLIELRPGQIPALDGLRAFAITMVIAGKSKDDFVFAGGIAEPRSLFSAIGNLWTGVDLFFVLSGFLIGRILLEEIKKTGTIQVFPFLLKRGFRIWPLYYFISGISLIHLVAMGSITKLSTFLPDLFFLTNYYTETLAFGSWSLSIEEQFYIIASTVLFLCRKQIFKAHFKIPLFLTFLLLIAPVLRMAVWQHYETLKVNPFEIEWELLHSFLHTHYDGLAIGLFLASVQVFMPPDSNLRTRMGSLLNLTTVLAGVMTIFYRLWFIYLFVALLFGAIVWHCLTQPKGPLSKFLSWPGFQIVSRLSYGMYLWYRFPLWRIASAVVSHLGTAPALLQFLLIFLIAFTMAAMLATVTFIAIEQPFLKLRAQLAKKSEVQTSIPARVPSALY